MDIDSEPETAEKPNRIQFRIRTMLYGFGFVGVFLGTNGFGMIGLHYLNIVENDPLVAPVQVTSVQNNTLLLADGRVIWFDSRDGSLAEIIKTSGNRLDIELEEDSKTVAIFAKSRGWVCGTPWAQHLINIPLIPDDVPINRRKFICLGKILANKNGKPK